MVVTTDPVALNQWIVCGWPGRVPVGREWQTAILGQNIRVVRTSKTDYAAQTIDDAGNPGRELAVLDRYCSLFTTLGEPDRPLPPIPEFDEADRLTVGCGNVGVHTSPYRLIENFLDMAHFPFVHTGILGAENEPEVAPYKFEHRKDIDELWATDCRFFQPAASKAAGGGQITDYVYRIMTPFSIMLYKTVYGDPSRKDAICLFVQPLSETECLAYPPMALVDQTSTARDVIDFQQTIFLQDRFILENQRPRRMPLDPRLEVPTKADVGSIAFRRWLRDKGLTFGIHQPQGA